MVLRCGRLPVKLGLKMLTLLSNAFSFDPESIPTAMAFVAQSHTDICQDIATSSHVTMRHLVGDAISNIVLWSCLTPPTPHG